MPGPAPKEVRRRRNAPVRGDWRRAAGVGWQYGDVPAPPDGLMPATVAAWEVWMGAWFAAHWTPGDVPGLCVVALLYDQVARGERKRAGEWRLWANSYGITPKGQQERRWLPPEAEVDVDGSCARWNRCGTGRTRGRPGGDHGYGPPHRARDVDSRLTAREAGTIGGQPRLQGRVGLSQRRIGRSGRSTRPAPVVSNRGRRRGRA
jgi:hypothetical protein